MESVLRRLPGRRILGFLLVGGAAAFLGLTIARNWQDLHGFSWHIRWGILAVSIVALTGVFVWGVVVWKLVLNRFDHPPVPFPVLVRIWFLSNLARYVPGKVWQFVGVAELARRAELSRSTLITSMLVQVGFSLLSASALSAIVLPGVVSSETQRILALALVGAALVFSHPAVLGRVLRLIPERFGGGTLRWRGQWWDGLLIFSASVVSWLLYGIAFTLLVYSVAGGSLSWFLPLAAVNAASFVAGYIVLIAPAGLGAREGAMAVLLRPFAPAGVAAVVAVMSRLWTIAAELLGAALVLMLLPRVSSAASRPPAI